ncbi:MAG: hypothetical protein WBB08_05650, partial [Halobacteriota archaeon]
FLSHIAFVISRLVLPRLRGGTRPNLNYSFITLGAILPDLIDKQIGRILLGESVANVRLFGHTLLFVLLLKLKLRLKSVLDVKILSLNRRYSKQAIANRGPRVIR